MLEMNAATRVRTHRADDPATFARVSGARRADAARVLARYTAMAESGLTHFRDLLRCENGKLRWVRHEELPRVRGGERALSEALYGELIMTTLSFLQR